MDVVQLRSFVALVEERHFTRAAARVHIAQPALSQQLRKLEQELGLKLVDRTSRRVHITAAGETLARGARAVLAEFDHLHDELADQRHLRSGRLVLGTTRTTGPFALAETLGRFCARYPGVELVVREGLSVEVAASLRAGEVDLGLLTALSADDERTFHSREVAEERLVVLLPPDHRLSARREIRLVELADERWVGFPSAGTIRRQVEKAAAEQGLSLHVGLEVGDATRMRSFVSAGLGVAVLPVSDATVPGPRVTMAELVRPHITHNVLLCWHRLTPAARAFVDEAVPCRNKQSRRPGPDMSGGEF